MSVIASGNTTTTALIYTGDTTGNLVFTTGGANTTALTLNNTQAATFANAATATAFIPSGSTVPTYGMYSPSANTIAFSTSGSATTIIDSSGTIQLGYGIAPTTASAPAGISICAPANSQLQYYLLKNTQIEAHFGFKSGSDGNLYVGTGGGVGSYGTYQANTANSWSSVSDETLKTDLKPILDALNKVASLRTVTGRYTYDTEDKSRSFLIAQDVQKVLPEAVSIADVDAGTLGLSYTDVIPLLVAAIKELKAEIDALKAGK